MVGQDPHWDPKPLLPREQALAIPDGKTRLARLSRLWPQVQCEGEALIRRDRDLLNVTAPGALSWAEYSTRDDFSNDRLVAADYLLEFLRLA